jgi:hypothetical protein
LFDRPPFIVPVVLNDPSTGRASQHTTVWVSRSDPRDVRIASETRAFIGSLYPVQESAGTIGVVLLLAGAEVAFIWWRQRRILAAHPWRSIAIAPSQHARECLGEPRGVRYRSRRLRLTSGGVLQIAGPREPAQTAWSIVRREACSRMYVVRGPLTAREPGPALRTAEHT